MCGRYTATDPEQILLELEPLGVVDIDVELRPRYNVAPSQLMPVVTTDAPTKLTAARWGLIPPWARRRAAEKPPKPLINARAETAAFKPSFRDAVKRRRCLVVADGYFEWKREGRQKTPHYVRTPTGKPFVFAGLFAPGAADDPVQTFAILTTEADELVAPIHDRMPLILDEQTRARWLAPDELEPDEAEALLRSAERPEMIAYPVAPAVGSPSVDSPTCIEPAVRQPSLFD